MEESMKEKRENLKVLKKRTPGIEILDDGIKMSNHVLAGRGCICSPGMWQDGSDAGGCGCGCRTMDTETNGTANCNKAAT